MTNPLEDPDLAAAISLLEKGRAPKLYTLNLDKPDGLGRCPENGSILRPECFGTWPPEHLACAILHASRGLCDRPKAQQTARNVPFRPDNLRFIPPPTFEFRPFDWPSFR